MSGIKNSILKGFNPDPSILRVDESYQMKHAKVDFLPVRLWGLLSGLRIY